MKTVVLVLLVLHISGTISECFDGVVKDSENIRERKEDVVGASSSAEDLLASEPVKRDGSQIDSSIVMQIFSRGPPNAGSFSPQPGKCVCVPYFLCSPDDVHDGPGSIDSRILVRSKNSSDPVSEFLDSITGNKKQTSPSVIGPSVVSLESPMKIGTAATREVVGGDCPGVTEVCCKKPLSFYDTEFAFKSEAESQRRECGVVNGKGVGAEIKFDNPGFAQYGEYPWLAVIVEKGPNGKDNYLCSGTLIHESVIMTAAHCVQSKNPALLTVILGEWDTQSHYELFPEQMIRVTSVVAHEEYNSLTLANDIALLFLAFEAEVNPAVSPACIPNFGETVEGTCWVAGWGKTGFGNPDRYQNILTKTEMPVINRQQCQTMLRRSRLGPYYTLDESMVCAGGQLDKDACQADGGSPLICPIPGHPGRVVVAGIASWAIGCGNGLPGVYTTVARFGPWIDYMLSQTFDA